MNEPFMYVISGEKSWKTVGKKVDKKVERGKIEHTICMALTRLRTKTKTGRGCLHDKTRTDASFIPGWLFDFVSRLQFEGTIHVDKIHVWFKIAKIRHALLVPVYRQTNFTPERVDERWEFHISHDASLHTILSSRHIKFCKQNTAMLIVLRDN